MSRNFAIAFFVCLSAGLLAGMVDWPIATLSAGEDAKSEVSVQILDWADTQKLIASKRGKVVVLDVWSNSCAPCLEEFPNLVALQKQQRPGVVCMSLNVDYIGLKKRPPESYKDRVLKFLTTQDARFDNVLCNEKDEAVFEKLGIPSIPAVLVYGRDGKLAKTFENSEAKTEAENFTYKDVTAFVDSLLKK